MAIFYTDTGSLSVLEVTGSTLLSGSITPLKVVGSGSNVMVVSGSQGALLELSENVGSGPLFTVASASIDVITIFSNQKVIISGSLEVTQGITGSLSGSTGQSGGGFPYTGSAIISGSLIVTGSLNVSDGITGSLLGSSSYAITASYALNGGGGGGFPYDGLALVTGSLVVTSGSGVAGTFLTASETLTAGDFINIGVGGVRRATNDDTSKQAHGFVTASYVADDIVDVFYGGLNTGVSGLTPGSRYFLGTTGGETTTPPTSPGQISQEVGVAVTSTAILVNIGPAIVT